MSGILGRELGRVGCPILAFFWLGWEANPSEMSASAKLLPVITKLLPLALLIATVPPAVGQAIPRPDVPDKLKAPAGEEVVLVAHASGWQIYVCQAGTDGQPAWTLKAPDAELHDAQGAVIGTHFAGPAWKLNDGSEVTGKPAVRVDAPTPDAVPWVLVTVTVHSGSGLLSRVTTIQRIHTTAGIAPPATECTAARLNVEIKSPYTADYYFYAPAK
jgi:hypothetical protein